MREIKVGERPRRTRPISARDIELFTALTGDRNPLHYDECALTWTSEYPDEETLGRPMVAVAGLAVLAGPEREDELRRSIVDGLAPYRTPEGGYRFSNEYYFLVARV
jgi:hypothetical protein